MKHALLLIFALLLPGSALAQTATGVPTANTVQGPITQTDDLYDAYIACVRHQVYPDATAPRKIVAPTYDVPWATEKCPGIVTDYVTRETGKKADRDKADLDKINKAAAKQIAK